MDDIFGGLEIADTAAADTTSAVDSSKAPATPSSDGKLTREQRLARAFQNSKDTWRPEHGLTESGWYIGLDRHPYDTDTRPIARKNGSSSDAATALSPASGSKVSQLDVKVMEYNISSLYAKGQYRPCLDRCLDYFRVEGVDASTKGAAGPANARGGVVDSDNLPPYNDVDEQQDFQLPVMSNTYKEILDVALRCAAILEDRKWCRRLASASRVMWNTSNNAAVTEAAAKALLAAGDLSDAALAIFHSIADRGSLLPYIRILSTILMNWDAVQESATGDNIGEPGSAKLFRQQLLELLRAIEHSLQAAAATPSTPTMDCEDQETIILSTLAALDLPTDQRPLVIDVWTKIAKARAVMMHPKQMREDDGEANVGRSVRTL